MKLYDFQKNVLEQTQTRHKVAYYLDMGLGKTFVGSEKAMSFIGKTILVICQKAKIKDWVEHFKSNYDCHVFNLTSSIEYEDYFESIGAYKYVVGVVNYDLIFRRPDFFDLRNLTLILDESSMVQNEDAKRTKAVMALDYNNLILLSGTPTGGKYENLYSQLKMLGLKMSKTEYWNNFINYYNADFGTGFPIKVVTGYKNVDRLKNTMRDLGCVFMKSDEVFDLPEQNFITVPVAVSSAYKKFVKSSVCEMGDNVLTGDTTLTQLLGERQLCGMYSKAKLDSLKTLLESTEDRVIIFYNFNNEATEILGICDELGKPVSLVNGNVKDLTKYESESNSVTLIQYQAGAMGLNLQKSNKIIYFTPCLSSELFEQSKKRIHRIGQENHCFYYQLVCAGSVEEKIYETLAMRKDFTERLFVKGE